jgi:DNA-binding HxlR family transcriptional regulator
MARKTPDRPEPRCSIARSLEVVGEKWSLLIIRDISYGKSRFSEIRDSLGIAPDILAARLATLVAHGVLERRAYREPGSRERYSYHLTPSGRDLDLVLAALTQWGDAHRPSRFGPARLYRHAGTDEPVAVAFADRAGTRLDATQVESVPGPGDARGRDAAD